MPALVGHWLARVEKAEGGELLFKRAVVSNDGFLRNGLLAVGVQE
jgi:hypothetical protein